MVNRLHLHIEIIYFFLILTFSSCNYADEKRTDKKLEPQIATLTELSRITDDSVCVLDITRVQSISYQDFSNKISDVKYIALKTPDPIGIIEKIIIYNNKIYVLDIRKAERIFIFDMEGNLLKIIADKGRGPREYLGLEDMNIDRERNELVINDRLLGGLLHFTLDGEFIRKSKSCPKSDFAIRNGRVLSHLTKFVATGSDYNVALSEDDSIFCKGFTYYPIQNHLPSTKMFFYNYKDDLMCLPPFSDTIYKFISDSEYKVKYIINHEKSIWKYRNKQLSGKEYNDMLATLNYSRLYDRFIELPDYIFLSLVKKDGKEVIINPYCYDKRTEETYELMDQKVTLNGLLPNMPVGVYKNSVIGIVEPYYFNLLAELLTSSYQNLQDSLQLDLKNIIKEWKIESDPIIVLYKFKS